MNTLAQFMPLLCLHGKRVRLHQIVTVADVGSKREAAESDSAGAANGAGDSRGRNGVSDRNGGDDSSSSRDSSRSTSESSGDDELPAASAAVDQNPKAVTTRESLPAVLSKQMIDELKQLPSQDEVESVDDEDEKDFDSIYSEKGSRPPHTRERTRRVLSDAQLLAIFFTEAGWYREADLLPEELFDS